jgi:HEPN domain-containing protein
MGGDKRTPAELRVDEWLRKAHEDELSAASLLRHRDGAASGVCFLAHQMAEKYLKAYLIAKRNAFPKIHPLDKLVELCAEHDQTFMALGVTAAQLDPYYTPARYPADMPEFGWSDGERAFVLANEIKQFVVSHLGVVDDNVA